MLSCEICHNKQKQHWYISTGLFLSSIRNIFFMTFNQQPFKQQARKAYSVNPERCFLITEKYFPNRNSFCLQFAHYYPKSAFRPGESECLVQCKNSQLLVSFELAYEILDQLPKILPPRNTVEKDRPIYSNWKFPQNCIIDVLPTGETIDTTVSDEVRCFLNLCITPSISNGCSKCMCKINPKCVLKWEGVIHRYLMYVHEQKHFKQHGPRTSHTANRPSFGPNREGRGKKRRADERESGGESSGEDYDC